MNRRVFCAASTALLLVPLAGRAAGPAGQTILLNLPGSAPFPDASRAVGHDFSGVHYDPETYYSDSTVGIYVPSRFRPGPELDVIVHFHGWNNHVEEVFRRYRLREQLEESGRNALLIVPQGPKDAPDSGFGKLELREGGFTKFLSDVHRALVDRNVLGQSQLRNIVLSSHSGGYGGAGGVLARSDMRDKVSDVILFDSAYGYFDAFSNWAKGDRNRHLLSLFTDDTSNGNAILMASLQGARSFQVRNMATVTTGELMTRQATFLVTTEVIHDELMQKFNWYAEFLRTTALQN